MKTTLIGSIRSAFISWHQPWKRLKKGPLIEVALAIGLSLLILYLLSPRISDITISQKGVTRPISSLPLELPSSKESAIVQFQLHTSPFQSKKFIVTVDDCLAFFSINDAFISSSQCERERRHARTFDLSPYLTRTINSVTMTIRDNGQPVMGLVDFSSHPNSAPIFAVHLIILTGLLLVSHRVLRLLSFDQIVTMIVILGIILRWRYVTQTPFNLRVNDVDSYEGHLDYIRYIANHWRLPPASGWEYHQAPLFYVLSAPLFALFMVAGSTFGILMLQYQSLLLSSATLITQAWIACQIFPQDRRAGRIVMVTGCALLGVYVMFSSQISNDVPLLLILSLGIARMMVWHRTQSPRDWYILIVLCGVAFITKTSGLVLGLASFASLIAASFLPLREKWTLGMRGALWLLVLTAWLPILSLHQSSRDTLNYLTGGIHNVSHNIDTRSLLDYVTFNPSEILRQTHSFAPHDDRKKYPLEYLFRTSFFGEHLHHTLRGLKKPILLFGILLLPSVLIGLFLWLWRKPKGTLPVMLVGGLALGCMYLYVARYQNAFHQNFRLTAITGLSVLYLLSYGIDRSPKILRWIQLTLFTCLALLMTIFLAAE